MKLLLKTDTVKIPANVKVSVAHRVVTVTGPRGTLTRNFRHLNVDIQLHENVLKVDCWFAGRKQAAAVRTICSHIANMVKGVMIGFEYHMRLVYAHFPINVSITAGGRAVEIRNYLGEKIVRRISMLEGVTISKTEKDELVLQCNDVEYVSQSAALIQQSCAVTNKDIRKFLDGIYVSERTTVVKE